MADRIGSFEFVALHGNPDALKTQVAVLTRPGVDGTAIKRQGFRGEPFTLRSSADAVNLAMARSTFVEYLDLIGQDPVQLVWAGLDLGGDGFLVAVIDVRPVRVRKILGGVGGLYYPSLGWVEAEWDLIPIAITT